ncbi:SpoIIE family protein phosphatase [Butyrivibrio sp. AE3009]|uniref:SpoIIE family protein phosphatase n=1 Tax=Butyrivibrio sp. AE3009 TaxID=1280666 RepID=UPI0003B5A910|nr:SpoIIE family protein phosphatase [Butyrivibrio sp. AE3009]
MISMIIKMSLIVLAHVILTLCLWKYRGDKKVTAFWRIFIGIIYGCCAVLSTHFGVAYSHMVLNVRDLGPLIAGLYFDSVSGIIAGLIGGIERYIAGTYFGVGSYTRIACSLSTCLSGFVAAVLHIFIFKKKKPSATYSFFMGAVMEVFHMYVVFITHRNDMEMAFYVVKICSVPMIIFCGLGLAIVSLAIRLLSEKDYKPFIRLKDEETKVSQQFQFWLFIVTGTIIVLSFLFAFAIQTETALQQTRSQLRTQADDIKATYTKVKKYGDDTSIIHFHVGQEGSFDIIQKNGSILAGDHKGNLIKQKDLEKVWSYKKNEFVTETFFETVSFCYIEQLSDDEILLVRLPASEVYEDRDAASYENAFADILLFAVIYVLISMLVKAIVVDNLDLVNQSLSKITNGNLNETVSVYNSSEFASLSNDINQTVAVLKSYIEAAEKRIAQELEFAKTIQESALPKNFDFQGGRFEIYATMNPAKEIGGDFYDFFFTGLDKFCIVIADVSGKGIPAALFMMRSKTAIRTMAESGLAPSEVLERANNTLCEGNDADMFVTVWIGILDLKTGIMKCTNAGHEYPMIRKAAGDFELLKDKHSAAVAIMEDMKFKEYELRLEKGDTIFVYTDGLPEGIDKEKEQFGTDRILDALNKNKDVSMERLLPRISRELHEFVGEEEQFDDETMVGFKFIGYEN